MRRMLCLVLSVICLLGSAAVQAAPVEFTYTGYVKVRGSYFSGPGQFKFAIVNRNGSSTFWSNDGTSRNAAQPTASLPLNVIDGYFAVAIGDTEAGMDPLDAAAFNSEQQYYLRVWFNDGTHGFERLTPDQRIVNPALLGATQQSSTIIYVNPVTGDDANVGNVPDSPKKTIQAAWNTLPNLINTTATIQLQDGVYRDTALLMGKTAVGNAQILIQGNATSSALTLITGANQDAPSSGTRRFGWELVNQQRVELRHLDFESFTTAAVFARDVSKVKINQCRFRNVHDMGIRAIELTSLDLVGCEFGPEAATLTHTPGLSYGVIANFNCYVSMTNSLIQQISVGAYLTRNCSFVSEGNTIRDVRGGVQVYACSSATFVGKKTTITRASNYGVMANSNSDLSYVTTNIVYSQMSGPTYSLMTGSICEHP